MQWFFLVHGLKRWSGTKEEAAGSPSGCVELICFYQCARADMIVSVKHPVFIKLVEFVPGRRRRYWPDSVRTTSRLRFIA